MGSGRIAASPRGIVVMTDHASLHELAMAELRKNRRAFNGMRHELERDHSGRIALLHDGKLVSIFNDRGDAYVIGCERFGEGHFSIKQIGTLPASLGAAASYTEFMPLEG